MSTEVEERTDQAPAAIGPPSAPAQHPVRDRLVLPLLLPIIACITVLVFALNFSRIFIAAKGTPALILCSVATAVILVVAALFSYLKRLRASTMWVSLAGLFLVVMLFGSIMIGSAEEKGRSTGWVEPEGDAAATLDVDAFAALKFQSDSFTTTAGIVAINYKNIENGGHTLAFRETEFSGFLLKVENAGDLDTGKVELAEGEYTLYCTLPGHAAAGMQASLTVTPGAGA